MKPKGRENDVGIASLKYYHPWENYFQTISSFDYQMEEMGKCMGFVCWKMSFRELNEPSY